MTTTTRNEPDKKAVKAAKKRRRRDSDEIILPRSLQPSNASKTITFIVLVGAAVYFMLPVWWLIMQTTKSYPEMISTPSLWVGPANRFWENVQNVLAYDGGNFFRWVLNSIFYSGASAVIGTLLSLSCGYSFSKFRYRGKKFLLGLILVGLLLPASLLTIPLFYLFSFLNIVNTVWAILIPCAVSPFGVFLSMIYCDTIPTELIEAARIDGAGELRIFFTIVIRLLGPAVVTIALFIFVATWNNFLLPLVMLRGKDLLPVTLGLYTWQNYKTEILAAQVLTGSLLGIIPVVLLFLMLQRYWRAGLSQGSVKA